jgi:acyl-CoA dehydrogenase
VASPALCAHATGAYARVRTQFDVPIGMFEGIRKPLADLAANIYLIDAARRLTIAALDEGHRPSVIAAIMKFHATERMRDSVGKSMDIHGGKAIIDGPRNYLGSQFRSAPIGITVEGANILTRNLMIFGQGAVRSHPYVLKEMLALSDEDEKNGLDIFDKLLWRHVGHAFATLWRAFVRGWSGGRIGPVPDGAAMPGYWKKLSRHAAAFALLADLSLLTLGGALKRKETISARLGDILSELYLLGAVLKRFEAEGRHEEDRPIVDYVMRQGQGRIAAAFAGVLDNLPARWAAILVRLAAFPMGVSAPAPSDELTGAVAETLMKDSLQRDRLTPDIYLGEGHEQHPLKDLERAFRLVTAAEPIEKKMRDKQLHDPEEARDKGVISGREFEQLAEAKAAVDHVIAVDAFPMEEISPIAAQHSKKEDGARQARRAL